MKIPEPHEFSTQALEFLLNAAPQNSLFTKMSAYSAGCRAEQQLTFDIKCFNQLVFLRSYKLRIIITLVRYSYQLHCTINMKYQNGGRSARTHIINKKFLGFKGTDDFLFIRILEIDCLSNTRTGQRISIFMQCG